MPFMYSLGTSLTTQEKHIVVELWNNGKFTYDRVRTLGRVACRIETSARVNMDRISRMKKWAKFDKNNTIHKAFLEGYQDEFYNGELIDYELLDKQSI